MSIHGNDLYMGRTYLSPPNRLPTAFWINCGTHHGQLCFPDWIPELESVCSREDELKSDLKSYFEMIRTNFLAECSLSLFCLIIPVMYYCYRVKQMKVGISDVLQRHVAKFNSPSVMYQFIQQTAPISRRNRAFDQRGRCLETLVNYDPHTARIKAVWPPLGHNFVVYVPQPSSIHKKWPPTPEVVTHGADGEDRSRETGARSPSP